MSSFRYNNARSVYLVNEKKIQFRIETTVDGEFSGLIYATFKNKNQIKSIFGKELDDITNDDLIYFVDPYRGSEYHEYLEEAAMQHILLFGDKEDDYRDFSFYNMSKRDQLIFLRHFAQTALDFSDFEVSDNFDVINHIETRFVEDKKIWDEIAKAAGKSLTISYRQTEL
jgi:hypothetical protein